MATESSFHVLLGRCDLPRVGSAEASLDWRHRGSRGVILAGLFNEEELMLWRKEEVVKRHGNESFYADNTRGNYAHPKLQDYVEAQRNDRMIFVSSTLRGAFGKAWRLAVGRKRRRKRLLEDFAERPIFSVGVTGGAVPTHDAHPETWHALLGGIKAWWLSPPGEVQQLQHFKGWEDPCGSIDALLQGQLEVPKAVKLCIQHAGEVLYFGDGTEHSTCTLSDFSLAVGAQGHTETWPPLLRAANRGDLQEVKELLKGQVDLRSKAPRYGHSALHRAALHGHHAVVKALLLAKADVEERDDEGLTASFLAAFSGHVRVLKQLPISQKDGKGASPLQWAATQGHQATVEFLLSRKADVLSTNDLGGGAVSAAATTGHQEVLRQLVAARGNVEESDDRGMRPLHWSALHGHLALLQSLLEMRADATAENHQKQIPQDVATPETRDFLLSRAGLPKVGKGRNRQSSEL